MNTGFNMVPPDEPVANMRYRLAVRKWAVKSKANKAWLMERCKKDFYFFLKTFVYLQEPRPEVGRSTVLPFLPWPHQIPMMDAILAVAVPPPGATKDWSQHDIGIEKARGEGATYSCLAIIEWMWLFHNDQIIGMVSRNELAADNPDDPDSLGAKIDWMLAKMPQWMTGPKLPSHSKRKPGAFGFRRNVSKHTWVNVRTNCVITAYPCTGDLTSGGRKTLFLCDEVSKWPRGDDEKALAATEPVSNCRLLVSTYYGTDGAYYHAMNEDSSMEKIQLRWLDNPGRSKNKFRIDPKRSALVDPNTGEPVAVLRKTYSELFFAKHLPMLIKRGFYISDSPEHAKKVWSPWYVDRCLRPRMTPQNIAEEYDIDPMGTGNRFFPTPLISDLLSKSTHPTFQGEVEYDYEKLTVNRVFRTAGGSFSCWLPFSHGGKWQPPPAKYVIGVDIASGLGTHHASNSALSIVNRETGVKVAEYASMVTMPEKLAELSIALARLFRTANNKSAFMIWEANGYGGAFQQRVLTSDFRMFYYRTPFKRHSRKASKEPGWWSTPTLKKDLMNKYRWALQEGFFTNPSDVAVREAGQYTTVSGGSIVFLPSTDPALNPSDRGDNHGDRCIADVLANYGMEYFGGGAENCAKSVRAAKKIEPKAGSFLHRRMEWLKTQKRGKNAW